ncbi:MAG: serine/threonine protein kinase [Chloroflexota bacterium]
MADLIGQTIRGYEFKTIIGSGGFGVVYRALQPSVNREVAIKVIQPSRSQSEHFVKRFDAEAQVIAKLEHPFIVPLFEYWHDDERAYLAMRLLHGGSLRNPLSVGPLDSSAIAKVVDQVGDALALAHNSGVVHRDLKPGNILLDGQGNYYLTDFGISKDLTGEIYESSGIGVTGSPAYISPEQAKSEEITSIADIYSFGVLLYEMFTGEHPFPDVGTTAQILHHISDPLPPLGEIRPDLPTELDQVIQTATEKNRDDRYQSMAEFSRAFHTATKGEKPTNHASARTRAQKPDDSLSPDKAKKFPIGLGIIFVLALLIVGILLRPTFFPAQVDATATTQIDVSPSPSSIPLAEAFAPNWVGNLPRPLPALESVYQLC